jgi:uncharacterized membrane protein
LRTIRFDQLPKLRALLRSHFFSGLLVVIPAGVIVWILGIALSTIWSLRKIIPDVWRPENWLPSAPLAWLANVGFAIGITIALALTISIIGWISKQLLGQKILEFISDHVIQRIPVIRSIYSSLNQLLRTIAAGNGHQFSRVVYVEYPRKGMWVIAFVTSSATGRAVPRDHLNLYVPTTPNPTSGFHVMVPETEVRDAQMSVEEAFRTILSLGIAQPAWEPAGGAREAAPAQASASVQPERSAAGAQSKACP